MSSENKGRCSRCCLSYYGIPQQRTKNNSLGNVCFKYDNYCQYSARNCTSPVNGFRRKDISKETLKRFDIISKLS